MDFIKDKAQTAADFLFGAALARYGFISLLFSWHLATLTESECLSVKSNLMHVTLDSTLKLRD